MMRLPNYAAAHWCDTSRLIQDVGTRQVAHQPSGEWDASRCSNGAPARGWTQLSESSPLAPDVSVFLPTRSLLVFCGEHYSANTHGVEATKRDLLDCSVANRDEALANEHCVLTKDGPVIERTEDRVSLTFRCPVHELRAFRLR
jgi:hypothetical protein